ncbi:MAG: hypothetical protein K9N49_09155, partial [Candidatus Marinimicrobia bacterium]|nr:hypothetical protein [Candidatus Neomarinimicrobiota bacterium]
SPLARQSKPFVARSGYCKHERAGGTVRVKPFNQTAYERNAARIRRYQAFFRAPEPGLMVRPVLSGAPVALPPVMPLTAVDWRSERSCRACARSRIEQMRIYWRATPDVGDEIPKLLNLAGTGAIAAAFVKDAVVQQEEDTNYLEAPIRNWDTDPARIGFDPDNPWYRAQMWMLREYIENWDGSFGILPFVHFDPLDLCNQWRGNELFMDYYDEPDRLHALLERATTCVLELERHLQENYLDGYGFDGCAMGVWTPGSYLSCDAGDMGGPDILREFGRPYTGRIVQAWGGAYLHHHELGIHQIVPWSGCEGLTLQFLNRDPNTEHLAQVVTDEHLASSFRVALGFIAEYDEFMRGAERWAAGKCVVAVRCADRDQLQTVLDHPAVAGGSGRKPL